MLLITEEGEIWITEGIAEQFTLNGGPDGDDTSFEGIKETAARIHLHVRPFLVRFFRGLGDSPFEERMTMPYPGGQGIA